MPITGDYTWTEGKETIKVTIPLKGVSPKIVDIFVTSSTLKVNYSPFIIDIVLAFSIVPTKHKATVKDGELRITLFKTEQSMNIWGSLELNITGDSDVKLIKKESVIAQEELEKELTENRKGRRIEDERFAVRKQMSLDETERNRLENLKHEEKSMAEKELYDSFAQMNMEKSAITMKPSLNSCVTPSSELMTTKISTKVKFDIPEDVLTPLLNCDNDDTNQNAKTVFDDSRIVALNDPIYTDSTDNDDDWVFLNKNSPVEKENDIYDENIENDENVRYLPPPRSTNTTGGGNKIDINFTPRIFPSPMRESKLVEEENWIAKNRRYIKKHGVFGGNKGGKGKTYFEYE